MLPKMARVLVLPGKVMVLLFTVIVEPLKVGAELNVCTPVNVCPASVRAMVALLPGKVIVVPSVPLKVMELLNVKVFPAAPVNV